MKKLFSLLILLSVIFNCTLKAQVTIGSNNPPKQFSILEIDTENKKGGIRLPQVTSSQRDTISVTGNTSTAPGLTIFNTTTGLLEYWDGTQWTSGIAPVEAVEPWQDSGTSNKATLNTHDIYQMGSVGIGINIPTNQLHVKNTSNPMRMEGLQSGVRADSLLSVDNTGVVRQRSVTALRKDIVATPTGPTFPGMLQYNTTSNALEFWNGTTWVGPTAPVEPWRESGTTNQATLNTQNIYQTGSVGIGINIPTNQLHVKSASNPMRMEGLQSGVRADSLLSVDNTGVVRQRSVTALRKDIVATPTGPTFPGMLQYNTTSNALEFWNGTTWIGTLPVEPWRASGTTNQATLNTQNIYQTGSVGIGINIPTNQLHVKSASNPMRMEGLLSGLRADSLLSVDNTGVVRQRSVTALRKDIVATPTGTAFPGMLQYNTTSNALEFWNGTTWVGPTAPVEPWRESGTTNQATLNTQNIYQTGSVGIGINIPTNQLHVKSASNPMRMEGLLSGLRADSLLSVDNTGVVRQRSVTALRKDIVATPTGPTFPGMLQYNTTSNALEFWNGTTWVGPTAPVEPWRESGTTNQATLNTQNIYQTGSVGIGINIPTNQLHVKSASNPMRMEGLLSGLRADSLLSVDNTGVVRQRSVTALRKDIVAPPAPVSDTFAGMMKFDPTSKTMQYYDGTTWQIIASNALFTKNEGSVKINTGAAGSIPTFGSVATPTTPNQLYTVAYTTPFTYGIAAWPENITSPTDANIYSGGKFIENPIVNQTHIWRVTLSYTKSANIYSQQIDVSLFNPLSSFRVTSIGTIASSRTSGLMTLYLITVADANSIGNGYQLQWSCSDNLTRLTIDNVTRISLYKD